MLAPTSRAARARPRHTAAAVTAFLALAVAPSDAPAITTNWTASSGQFTTPTNWSAGVPGSADTAVFRRGLGITYNVTFPGGSLGTGPTMYSSDRAVVGNNFATFINSGGAREPSIYTLTTATTTEAGRGLIVGELASETGASLTSTLKELSTAAATLGDVAGSTGTLNINNGSLFSVTGSDAANVELIIANRGNAILNVNGGSDVTLTAPSGNAIVGYNAGSNGTLNVDGAGSTFAVTSSGFTVGHLGSGALNVTAGGQVTASITNLGRQPGASGSALISGAGSTFSSGQLTVGDQTTGTITVQNGGQLSSAAFATVGNQRVTGGTGNGTVTVDGAGSTWSTGTLALGVVGLGTLNVSNGGNVTVTGTIGLGQEFNADGKIAISGGGSTLTSSGPVYVGRQGHGEVIVSAGGQASSGSLYLGEMASAFSFGKLKVDGPGSNWSVTDQLKVGAEHVGVLEILNGGQVTSPTAYICNGGSATGNATVDGAGSTWTISNTLIIGQATFNNGPSGNLWVRNGGQVSVAGDLQTSTVASSNIELTSGGSLTVGGNLTNGTGGLSVLTLDGGTLDMTGGNIGGATPIDAISFYSGTLKNVAQINNGAGLTKTSEGTLTLDGTNTYTGITAVSQGTLVFNTSYLTGLGLDVLDGAVARVTASGAPAAAKRVLKTRFVTTRTSGRLEMNDNDLLVDYSTSTSPEAAIRQLVKNGRATGYGITSTPGSPDDDKVLAVADNTHLNKTAWLGVNIDTSTIIGKYTYFGDANLDGKVTGDDYLNVDANLGTGDSWLEGDFNMSGVTTGDDYLAIDANLGKGTANPLGFAELKEEMIALHAAMFGEEYLVKLARAEAEGFGASVVPEPAAGAVPALGALAARRVRRRKAAHG